MIVGISMSLLGTIIIGMGSSQGNESSMMLGNILAFMGAIFVAGYLVIGGFVRRTVSAGAVSYTHLDVYKRQPFVLKWKAHQ